jgi:hypothetical protein
VICANVGMMQGPTNKRMIPTGNHFFIYSTPVLK